MSRSSLLMKETRLPLIALSPPPSPRSPRAFHVEHAPLDYTGIGAVRAWNPRAARSSDSNHSL